MGADLEWRICVEENPNARRRGKGESPIRQVRAGYTEGYS